MMRYRTVLMQQGQFCACLAFLQHLFCLFLFNVIKGNYTRKIILKAEYELMDLE